MENENNQVEAVTEPKVESRFGFQRPTKALSNNVIKLCMIGTVVTIGIVLWMKNPERPESSDSGFGVKTPETSEVGAASQVSVEDYSAEQESNQIKDKNKKKATRVIMKLPGLQKIDRRRLGQFPPGSEVKARLITGASNGLVRAEFLESLKIRGETFVTAGETILGQGQSTEDRLFIRFTQIIHRDGSVETVQAQGADIKDKTAGLKVSKVARYAMKYGAAVGLNFVGGMAEGLQEKTAVGQQAVASPTVKNALLNGASRAAIEMANDTMSNMRNQPPPIAVDAGHEIIVIFESGNQL